MELDLPLRTQDVLDLLLTLDKEERAWDRERNQCKGDLTIVSYISSARGGLMTALNALNKIDEIVLDRARRDHDGKDGQ